MLLELKLTSFFVQRRRRAGDRPRFVNFLKDFLKGFLLERTMKMGPIFHVTLLSCLARDCRQVSCQMERGQTHLFMQKQPFACDPRNTVVLYPMIWNSLLNKDFALMFQLVKIYMQNTIRTLKVHDFVRIAADQHVNTVFWLPVATAFAAFLRNSVENLLWVNWYAIIRLHKGVVVVM